MPDSHTPIRTPANAIAYLGCATLLNVPFVVCHPGWPIVDLPLVRSLVVGLVLFLLPGLPWLGVMVGRGRPARFRVLWAVAISMVVLLGVLAVFRLAGRTVTGSGVWSATWIITNAAVLLNMFTGGPPAWGIHLREPCWRTGGPLFLAGYLLFFYSATHVVPPQEDHDLDIIPSGYALLTRFEPLFVGDYHSVYQFAHPPLFHYWVAGSLLYFDRLEYLEYYDQAARRARAAIEGDAFEPFEGAVGNLAKGTGEHRVVGVDGPDYLIDPPLADGSTRMPAVDFEHAVIGAYYENDPCLLEARTPAIFLSALTVALLGCWIGSTIRAWWPALLVPLAYATSPEVFVRSGYAGYMGVSNYAVLMMLMTTEAYQSDRRRSLGVACFLAGTLAGLANHKLILLPAAVVAWQLVTRGQSRPMKRLVAGVLHPVVIGFVAATATFWLFGLSASPGVFWEDHVRMHLVDRIIHHNPLGYGGYPGVLELWAELGGHTGYLLLPIGVITLVLGWLSGDDSGQGEERRLLRSTFRLWAAWTLITAAALSMIDWRQTKHLMPLMVVLHLTPVRWAARQRGRLALVGAVFCALLAWNLWALRTLVVDFESFQITPAW